MNDYWGYHLILDCSGCDPVAIKNPETLRNWIAKLVSDIDMKAHGDPVITYNGEEPYHSGYTVVQVITTSSIVAHFIDNPASCYLDVFSCKPFDFDIVKNSMKDTFGATRMRQYYITRQAD
jgi:S-adenosylmethionine/arginine decarboxylase-like enzyme